VQLFDRLFVQTLETARAPQLLKEEIDTIIALLYQFNGEIFNAPQTTRTLSFTHNTRRNIERYLQECARANATKAQRIIDRIERTSLRTLGVLHGSGGHGGGVITIQNSVYFQALTVADVAKSATLRSRES
jgi:hypothetical protein